MDDKNESVLFKGMRKQLLVLLGVSAGTKYLLCDETFDGLDPVMRQGVKAFCIRDHGKRIHTGDRVS